MGFFNTCRILKISRLDFSRSASFLTFVYAKNINHIFVLEDICLPHEILESHFAVEP